MNIRYLILSLTTRCNLACAYCYYGGPPQAVDMSEAVLEAALNLAGEGDGPLHVQLTGGEPTLVSELIEKAARGVRGLARSCTIGIQTNGTRLNPDLANLFKTFDIQVGVSLDGLPRVQQELRGQAAETLRGLQLLEACGIPFRVTTVVSQSTVGQLDRLVWILAGFGQVRGIGLDLLVCKGRGGPGSAVLPAEASALKEGLGIMLAALEAVNRRRPAALQLRELELLKKGSLGGEKTSVFCHACRGESVAVYPDGRLFPCGQTLGDMHFCAGDVWRPEPERLRFFTSCRPVPDLCDRCPLNGRCPGECPSRLHYNRGKAQVLACTLYRVLWESETGSEKSLGKILK